MAPSRFPLKLTLSVRAITARLNADNAMIQAHTAILRELKEELGIEVPERCLSPLTFASHTYETYHLLMPLYACRNWHGEPEPQEGQTLAWVRKDKLRDYPMPSADVPLIPILQDWL